MLSCDMKKNNKKAIGVFDSGFGGLSVLRHIVRVLPEYDYVYLGDTARMPYGARSQEVIYEFTQQAVDFLFQNNCELIILACNTASSEALRKIQQEYLPKYYPKKRVLGVIIPAAEEAIEVTGNNKIGVMATESAVASGAFERELKKLNPLAQVFQQGCPLLVPIVESGEQNSEITDVILRKYITPLMKKNIDTLILGCTHYGILESKIKNITGQNIRVISEGKIVAKKMKQYLQRHSEIERILSKKRRITFYTTDITNRFKDLGSKFFGKKIAPIKAHLEHYPLS